MKWVKTSDWVEPVPHQLEQKCENLHILVRTFIPTIQHPNLVSGAFPVRPE